MTTDNSPVSGPGLLAAEMLYMPRVEVRSFDIHKPHRLGEWRAYYETCCLLGVVDDYTPTGNPIIDANLMTNAQLTYACRKAKRGLVIPQEVAEALIATYGEVDSPSGPPQDSLSAWAKLQALSGL